MMKFVNKLKPLIAVGAFMLISSGASAATCTTAGVTLDAIDGSAFGPTDASVCENFAGNIGAGSVFIDGLNDGTFFAGEFAVGTIFTFVGKDEDAADGGSAVEADVGSSVGDWLASFAPEIVNNVIVALKGGTEGGALFLFKDLATAGSLFEGTFDMFAAGLINPSDKGADLSNLSVAGVFVDCTPGTPGCGGGTGVVPLPAGLPLFLSALGIVGLVKRRSRKSA